MESCRSEPLKFDCNKKIDINPKEYWEEIMQLTFLNDKSEYLSLARLSYKEKVYINITTKSISCIPMSTI